ncbi:AtpZ/AtpI family protein [Rhizobium sp. KVB221]|uniref:ATP synthase protein I n=1 Tax=Rhizobium setariae TaxID=2801340 RepID=A0A937CNJ8_9HYPH|nr:AtpZ/AtpI family protein [Rhizobium setariae]MBL0370747.1 AtpZ/AtpI family protein [Rhizobium setariae]
MGTDRKDSLEDRMGRLEDRLTEARATEKDGAGVSDETRKGYSQGLKISSEFIAAVIVGAMIGYLLDYILSSKPWGMIVFLLLGFCAGVLNVLRVVGVVKSPHPVDRIGAGRKQDNARSSSDKRNGM